VRACFQTLSESDLQPTDCDADTPDVYFIIVVSATSEFGHLWRTIELGACLILRVIRVSSRPQCVEKGEAHPVRRTEIRHAKISQLRLLVSSCSGDQQDVLWLDVSMGYSLLMNELRRTDHGQVSAVIAQCLTYIHRGEDFYRHVLNVLVGKGDRLLQCKQVAFSNRHNEIYKDSR